MRMLYTAREMYFTHIQRGLPPVVSRQPLGCVFFLFVVGRRLDSSRDGRWVLGLQAFSPQLVNELARCSVASDNLSYPCVHLHAV